MKISELNQCSLWVTDEDIAQAMKKIPGYLDITPADFVEGAYSDVHVTVLSVLETSK